MEPTPEDAPIEPCKHMEEYINALSDDTLHGPARWYTQLHVLHCQQCSHALRALRKLHERLGRLRSGGAESNGTPLPGDTPRTNRLSSERRSALENALDAVDDAPLA